MSLQVKEQLFRRLSGELPYELEPVPTESRQLPNGALLLKQTIFVRSESVSSVWTHNSPRACQHDTRAIAAAPWQPFVPDWSPSAYGVVLPATERSSAEYSCGVSARIPSTQCIAALQVSAFCGDPDGGRS